MNGAESPDEDGDNEEEEGGEYRAPKLKKTSASPDKVKAKVKVKRPRTAKGVAAPKAPGTGTRRGRKAKVTGDAFDSDKVAKEAKINNDNVLFSAYFSCWIQYQETLKYHVVHVRRYHHQPFRCTAVNSGGLSRVAH